jgi:hypothetical protein
VWVLAGLAEAVAAAGDPDRAKSIAKPRQSPGSNGRAMAGAQLRVSIPVKARAGVA